MGETVKGSRQTQKRQIRNEILQCHHRKPLRPLYMHSLQLYLKLITTEKSAAPSHER